MSRFSSVRFYRLRALISGILMASILAGCAAVVGGGVATGAGLLHDRRDSATVIRDEKIELQASIELHRSGEIKDQTHINITSFNRIVLLTGEAPNETLRQQVVELVRAIPNVRQVHDEIRIAPSSSFGSRSNDSLITTKVKAALFKVNHLPGFDPTRVKVVTENRAVFLMGLLRHVEAKAAGEAARRVSGVQQVVKLFEYID